MFTSGGSGQHGNDDKKNDNVNPNKKHGKYYNNNDKHPWGYFPDTSKPDYKSFIFFSAGVFITSGVFMYREKHDKQAANNPGGEAVASAELGFVGGGEVDGTVSAEKKVEGQGNDEELTPETEEDKKERERKQLYRDYLSYLTSR